MVTMCRVCGERPVQARGLCNTCYRRLRRRGDLALSTMAADEAVIMISCPIDAEFGKPMYPGCPLRFSRLNFQLTLALGYWPTGSIFEYAPVFRGEKARWKVNGRQLVEVAGERVMIASMKNGYHAKVRLRQDDTEHENRRNR